ncbi:MAG: hypothetical protein WAX89_03255 [Alphaproteobacteria bacterium]
MNIPVLPTGFERNAEPHVGPALAKFRLLHANLAELVQGKDLDNEQDQIELIRLYERFCEHRKALLQSLPAAFRAKYENMCENDIALFTGATKNHFYLQAVGLEGLVESIAPIPATGVPTATEDFKTEELQRFRFNYRHRHKPDVQIKMPEGYTGEDPLTLGWQNTLGNEGERSRLSPEDLGTDITEPNSETTNIIAIRTPAD